MTVSQISVFANSRPGHMNRVLDLFEGAGVSVRGFSAAEAGRFDALPIYMPEIECASREAVSYTHLTLPTT